MAKQKNNNVLVIVGVLVAVAFLLQNNQPGQGSDLFTQALININPDDASQGGFSDQGTLVITDVKVRNGRGISFVIPPLQTMIPVQVFAGESYDATMTFAGIPSPSDVPRKMELILTRNEALVNSNTQTLSASDVAALQTSGAVVDVDFTLVAPQTLGLYTMCGAILTSTDQRILDYPSYCHTFEVIESPSGGLCPDRGSSPTPCTCQFPKCTDTATPITGGVRTSIICSEYNRVNANSCPMSHSLSVYVTVNCIEGYVREGDNCVLSPGGPICGNGVCEAGESPNSCAVDCKTDPAPPPSNGGSSDCSIFQVEDKEKGGCKTNFGLVGLALFGVILIGILGKRQ